MYILNWCLIPFSYVLSYRYPFITDYTIHHKNGVLFLAYSFISSNGFSCKWLWSVPGYMGLWSNLPSLWSFTVSFHWQIIWLHKQWPPQQAISQVQMEAKWLSTAKVRTLLHDYILISSYMDWRSQHEREHGADTACRHLCTCELVVAYWLLAKYHEYIPALHVIV